MSDAPAGPNIRPSRAADAANQEAAYAQQARGRDWSSHPPYRAPAYRSTLTRGPAQALVPLPASETPSSGPVFGHTHVRAIDADLTRNALTADTTNAAPLGERIILTGAVIDERARPQPGVLIELWQANAAGRYIHTDDQHNAPLDPHFFGGGRCVSDAQGRYRFTTIKPGAYPWGNHTNAWRPAHIHLSLFGPTIASRLITQVYFPGDPLLDHDPIYLATPLAARPRLVASFTLDETIEGHALGYRFDIVLRGSDATAFETA
ncbi:MAG: protocatechuate 3,4-dioxygenase subunit beta [Pseudomonadota bacterium]